MFAAFALRGRNSITDCMRRWPLYEPVPDHPTSWTNDYIHDREGRLYPVAYHRNRVRLHAELLPRSIEDVSQTPLARAIAEATGARSLNVLDPKLQRLDKAIRAYAGRLLKSNSAIGSELLELNEAVNELTPYANLSGPEKHRPGDSDEKEQTRSFTVATVREMTDLGTLP